MKNRLQSVRIRHFKRISDAAFDVGDVNVLVGANNSGKSSIIQGLHFGVALLQTVGLADKWPKSSTSYSTSLSPNQLIYSPAEDIYALGRGGKLFEKEEGAIRLDFNLASGEACSVSVRKGRNRNILVAIKGVPVAKRLSSLKEPFSIFSPGLAGIAKRENFVSDGVLLRTLARGDANLVLRNILFRLWGTDGWNHFLTDLHYVFPGLEIEIEFKNETDEFVEVRVKAGADWVPLELAGTGILQAMQILSYVHRFEPSIVALDEPDSHLHPNNQRLLCSLLRRVSEEREIQVLLTTHSRHVVEAVGSPSGFLWIRDGAADVASADDEIGVLLDIGALDVKERAGQPGTEAVILTEDENTRGLGAVFGSSGFNMLKAVILPYYGVTTIKQLRPLVKVIRSTNPKAKIVVHRDRDLLTNEEVEKWKAEVRAVGVEPFVTVDLDIESYFINPAYLAEVNDGVGETEFASIIEETQSKRKSDLTELYINGRVDLERKAGTFGRLDLGKLATEAGKAISANPHRYSGKLILHSIRGEYRSRYGKNLSAFSESQHIRDDELVGIAKKLPKTKAINTKSIK